MDYLYESEWDAMLVDGTLSAVHAAFSRDQVC